MSPNDVGIGPVNLLADNCSTNIAVMLPIDDGRDPNKLLPFATKVCIVDNLPIEEGIVPTKLRPPKLKRVTLPLVHTTDVQEQTGTDGTNNEEQLQPDVRVGFDVNAAAKSHIAEI